MNNRIVLIILLAVTHMVCLPRVSAQGAGAGFSFPNYQCEEKFHEYRKDYQTATSEDQKREAMVSLGQLFNARLQPGCLASLLLAAHPDQVRADLFLGFATALERQAGSTSSTSGSTSLVSKNFTSRVLSIANEYGALTSSTSGQTTTVSGSLDQLFTAIEKASQGAFVECAVKTIPGVFCARSGAVNFLGRFSYSASLDLNQPSTITGTATGTTNGGAQQVTGTQGGNSFALSQFTSKVYLWAAKPTKEDFLNALTSSPDDSGITGARHKLVSIQDAADKDGAWRNWLENEALPDLSAASEATVDAELLTQTKKLVGVLVGGGVSEQDLVKAALSYSAALAGTAQAERSVYDTAAWAKPIFTFEYDYNTPANRPTNSTFRLIWGQLFKKLPNWKMTANVAGSIYNSTPSSSIPGSGRLRDFQCGIEADHNPYKLGNYLSATFSAAYYFQDQTSPAILNITPSTPLSGISFTGLPSNATQVFTQKGNIHVGQIKITFSGNSRSGWKFPIAITGANRSELITKSTVGAQVGISYDFDSLFSGSTSKQ